MTQQAARAATPARRGTRRSVRIIDRCASTAITVGGLAVIVTVLGMLVYLSSVVLPLFRSPAIQPRAFRTAPALADALAVATDDYFAIASAIHADGTIRTTVIESGDELAETVSAAPEGERITAVSRVHATGAVAVGFGSGAVAIGSLAFETSFLTVEEVTESQRTLAIGESHADDRGVVTRVARDQFRLSAPGSVFPAPANLRFGEGGVTALDYQISSANRYLVALREDGTIVHNTVRVTRALDGSAPRIRLRANRVDFEAPEGRTEPPAHVFAVADGTGVLLLWPDGLCQRYGRVGSARAPTTLVETVALTGGDPVTSATMLLGGLTVLVGTTDGTVIGAFAAPDERTSGDGRRLVLAHRFKTGDDAVRAIGISRRDRTIIGVNADGTMQLRNVTSARTSEPRSLAGISDPIHAVIAPKLDNVLVVDASGGFETFGLAAGFPEASVKALFQKVPYEGEAEPQFVYQSSASSDAVEPKLSLTPLIFGTLKATVYAMLFAAPIAVLAALYTSEILHPRARATVKPVIEMMASLPSVVLGFIAALVLAPYATRVLPSLLLALFMIPVVALLAGHLLEALPVRVRTRLGPATHLLLVIVVLLASALGARALGPSLEHALFRPSDPDTLVAIGSVEPIPQADWPAIAQGRSTLDASDRRQLRTDGLYFVDGLVVRPTGSVDDPAIQEQIRSAGLDEPDLRSWLDGTFGGAWPGWVLLACPSAFIVVMLGRSRWIDPRLSRGAIPPIPFEFLRFGCTLGIASGVGLAAATVLTAVGLDPRDSVFGPFSERNSLVLGIAMGFAVIPIIYTISEDAMSAVPDTLRSASLGAGATKWQTAVRVVLPVATSGVFSACMIGLGRAVGETMIVLMATGSTPIMEWNVFSGFRTLAANIAIELPEAPQGSTHYRLLFLCGLVLFLITFVINSVAEVVRQRFRARSLSL